MCLPVGMYVSIADIYNYITYVYIHVPVVIVRMEVSGMQCTYSVCVYAVACICKFLFSVFLLVLCKKWDNNVLQYALMLGIGCNSLN